MAPGNQFHYQPIQLNPPQTRLLLIQPGRHNETIRCTLIHVCLDECSEYEALSYTWGHHSEIHDDVILLQGRDFSVTRNVFAALKYLRLGSTTRTVWIDAICIDQSNIQERSSQVQQMQFIYSNARRTIIWLGETGENSELAVASIIDIARYGFFDTTLSSAGQAILRQRDSDLPSMLKFQGEDYARLTAIKDLLSRAWFHRMWVVQELSVSTEAVLIYGSSYVDWNVLSDSVAVLIHCTELAESAMIWEYAFARMATMDLCRRRRRRRSKHKLRGGSTINGLIHDFRDFEATDPRDKVYSLLGLAKDVHDPDKALGEALLEARNALASIDYSKSTATVYKELARYVIIRHRSLNLLSAAIHTAPDGRTTHGLPSWTPDWSKRFRASTSAKNLYRRYRATKGSPTTSDESLRSRISNDDPIRFSDDINVLIVQGIRWTIAHEVFPGSAHEFLRHLPDLPHDYKPLLAIGEELQQIEDQDAQTPRVHAHGIAKDFNTFRLSLQRFEPLDIYTDRVFILLDDGQNKLMALASCEVQKGDVICFLYDQGVPFALRKMNDETGYFRLVGQ
jgi:Heterokaryon incompatibility protein (HET)